MLEVHNHRLPLRSFLIFFPLKLIEPFPFVWVPPSSLPLHGHQLFEYVCTTGSSVFIQISGDLPSQSSRVREYDLRVEAVYECWKWQVR